MLTKENAISGKRLIDKALTRLHHAPVRCEVSSAVPILVPLHLLRCLAASSPTCEKWRNLEKREIPIPKREAKWQLNLLTSNQP